jgi:hypothetical protein
MLLSACDLQKSIGDPDTGAQTVAYVNGRWYDGTGFVERTGYVRAGEFVAAPRGEPGATVDLDGAFVLHAFAEAHHRVGRTRRRSRRRKRRLSRHGRPRFSAWSPTV